jgi:hypothetical protein
MWTKIIKTEKKIEGPKTATRVNESLKFLPRNIWPLSQNHLQKQLTAQHQKSLSHEED